MPRDNRNPIIALAPGDFVVAESSTFTDRHFVAEVVSATQSMVKLMRARAHPDADDAAMSGKMRSRGCVLFVLGQDRAVAVATQVEIDEEIKARDRAVIAANEGYRAAVRALAPTPIPN